MSDLYPTWDDDGGAQLPDIAGDDETCEWDGCTSTNTGILTFLGDHRLCGLHMLLVP